MRLFLLLIIISIFINCKTINNNVLEKRQEELADFDQDLQEELHNEHIYQIKEGASGGFEDVQSGYVRE